MKFSISGSAKVFSRVFSSDCRRLQSRPGPTPRCRNAAALDPTAPFEIGFLFCHICGDVFPAIFVVMGFSRVADQRPALALAISFRIFFLCGFLSFASNSSRSAASASSKYLRNGGHSLSKQHGRTHTLARGSGMEGPGLTRQCRSPLLQTLTRTAPI